MATERRAWASRAGAALTIIGVVALLAGILMPGDEDVRLAATEEEATEAPATDTTWRKPLQVAGGICLSAGLGLLALLFLPKAKGS